MARPITDAEADGMLGMAPARTRRVPITDEEADRRMSLAPTDPAVIRAEVKGANRAKGIQRPPPAPSAPATFTRGLLVEGLPSVAGAAGSVVDALIGMGARLGVPGTMGIESAAGEDWQRGSRRAMESVVPIPPGGSSVAREAGKATAYGLAGAPLALTGGLPLAAAEVALSGLGGAVGEEVRQATESEGAGIGAELLATAGSPLILGPKVVAKSPQIANAARRLILSVAPSPEALAHAERLGVGVTDLHRAAGELKAFVPEHASGDERYIADWIRYLDEGVQQFGPNEMPTTRQFIEARRDAGSALASLEEGLGSKSKGFGMQVAGRRQAAEDALRREVEALRTGDPSALAYDRLRDMRWEALGHQWDAVPRNEMPVIRTADLKVAAQQAVDAAGEFAQDIPEEALRVLEWPDEVPWSQYQAMRSRMLKAQRVGSRGTAETMSQMQVDNRAHLIRGFQRELERLTADAGSHGQAYRDALRSTAGFYDDFDPTSVVTRGYEDMTEVARVATRIRSSKDPAGEASRAVRIFAQDQGQLEAFRRTILDDIIGPGELNPGTAKGALKKLRANRNLIEAVWGPTGYRHQESILERARTVSIGRTGKSAQAMSTGSGRSGTADVAAPMSAIIDPLGTAVNATVKAVLKSLDKSPVNSRILREAMLDPQLASFLLKLPEPRAVEAWVIGWKQLSARSALKVGAQESAE